MAAGLAPRNAQSLGRHQGGGAGDRAQARRIPPEPFLRIIVEEVDRLNDVVTQFLNYAKPFQGKPEWADLRVVTQDCELLVLHYTLSPAAGSSFQAFRFLMQCRRSNASQQLLSLVLSNLSWKMPFARSAALAQKGPKKSYHYTARLAHTIREGKTEVSLSAVEDNGRG